MKSALSLKEAGQLLGVHPETVRREIRRGHLKAFKLGRSSASVIRILPSELKAYIERSAVAEDRSGRFASYQR